MMRLFSCSSVVSLTAALSLAVVMSVSAVDLKPIPIQETLRMQIADDTWTETASDATEKKAQASRSVDQEQSSYRAPWKSGALSLLLPGAGQLYNHRSTKAKVFLGVEAAFWVSFVSFRTYANWREEDFINFAAQNAGADLRDKDKEFQDWVGFYDDIYQYNTAGRIIAPERPYLVDNAENHWQWVNQGDKATYRHIKNRAREADKRADLTLGLLIANRLISAIDAFRDAIRDKRQSPEEFSTSSIHPEVVINPFDPVHQVYVGIAAPL